MKTRESGWKVAQGSGKPALWTPSFTLLTLANFGVSMSFFLLMSTMASYAVVAFAASNTKAGLVNSVFILGAMASRLVAGRAIELKGYRVVMIGSVIVHFLAVAAYLLTTSLWLTVFVRTVHGLAFGMTQTAISGAVMAKVPSSRRGEGSGWFTTGMSIATGLAPFLGLMLYNSSWGQTGVFVLTAAMSGMTMVLSLIAVRYLGENRQSIGNKAGRQPAAPSNTNDAVAKRADAAGVQDNAQTAGTAGDRENRRRDGNAEERKNQRPADAASGQKTARLRAGSTGGRKIRPRPVSFEGFFDPRAFPIALVVALSAFSFSAALTFLDGFAKQVGLEGPATWYFVVYAVVILFSRPVAGVVQDKFGDDVVVVPLIISVVVGMTLTALSTNGVMLLIGAAFLGFGYGTIVSAGQAIAVSKVGAVRAGLAVSSYFLLVDAGTGAAPVLLGALVDPLGYRKMMLVAASVGVLALVLYVLQILRRKASKTE